MVGPEIFRIISNKVVDLNIAANIRKQRRAARDRDEYPHQGTD
jgi:hypothetical protein